MYSKTNNKLSILLFFIFSLLNVFPTIGKNNPQLLAGFPDRSPHLDALPDFKNPPKGYGEVPFYWWVGDTLTHERILWQLDQLKDKSITGLQINYCHTDKGGSSHGLTYASQPALFTEKWWKLFKWFQTEAKKRNMSVSLSDYTLTAAGQGWFIDEMLKENPHLQGSKLESKQWDVQGNTEFSTALPEQIISAKAFLLLKGQSNQTIELKQFIKQATLKWEVPSGNWKVVVVYQTNVKTSFDPMNPICGKIFIEKFFQRFENHCPGESGKGLNFFFSDELNFGIRGFLWNDIFAAQFKKRKGYDINTELSHLFIYLSPLSYKIRLDYNDVMVALSEEYFFKPLYNWHTSRGMLLGCDHGGRGYDVTEFGDYFRTQRWMSGPGNDQPGLDRDIIKNKISSSIAHLYERPRTWLEGFHSSGWGTSSEEIADATFANFAMGHNLLSLHGLYYTTKGGWWEWAAPDNHFRQPYWANSSGLMKCIERMSYILSQGHHRCDVAIIYPVAPIEANLKGALSVKTAFDIASDLYPSGIDFDFMDFESLNRCHIINKELKVSGEQYKILILPALSAVRYSTLEKALAFYRSGGIVLAVGTLPEASERIGGNDDKLQEITREMFGTSSIEEQDSAQFYTCKNKAGGVGVYFAKSNNTKKIIQELIQPDFKILSEKSTSNILHRKLGNRDLYYIYGVPRGTECLFRCKGKVELWNPWNGDTKALKISSLSDVGTTIHLPLEQNEPQLIIFSPGKADMEGKVVKNDKEPETLELNKDWEFEIKPTLDNKYGDFRQPAYDGKIGVEVWKMKFALETENSNYNASNIDDSTWETIDVSYGPQFMKLGPFPTITNLEELEVQLKDLKQIDMNHPYVINGKSYNWHPYEFSWRWGLKNDAGHQGYHGLKGGVNNHLISLGKLDKSRYNRPENTLSIEAEGTIYYIWSTIVSPIQHNSTLIKGGLQPAKIWINHSMINSSDSTVKLSKGNNPVLLRYETIGRSYCLFKAPEVTIKSKKLVSLATDWYLNPAILPFDCKPQTTNEYGWYRFMAPPGAHSAIISSLAKPEVWINGRNTNCKEYQLTDDRIADENLTNWKVDFTDSISESSKISIRLKQLPGLRGGAAIPEPVVFECGKGKLKLGDLAENPALRTYSGGMWYRKNVIITSEQLQASKIILDLGKLVSSVEVFINGKSIGVKSASPWIFDISSTLATGKNRIEILIHNTLGNYSLTTPSMYNGRKTSGLIGPVKIIFKNN